MAYEPGKYELKDKIQDADDAFTRVLPYHREINEIHKYFMPFRQPTSDRSTATGNTTEGAKRTDVLFDSTGPSAAFAFVANMKADWCPAFDDFFKLQNGPLYLAEDAAQRNEDLQKVTRVAHAQLVHVRNRVDEMFSDLFAGTGAMMISKGDRRGPIRGVAVPTTEIALIAGPWNDVDGVVWKRNYKTRHLEQMWPDGKFSDVIARAIKEKRNDNVQVTQYTYWDAKDEMFKLCVWSDLDKSCEFHSETLMTTPWVTPRQFVVPGEAMGRGLGHLGLPGVKTLNKARELALRAAAFALLGLWTRRNDNVFNPDTAVMAPGAMWKVAYADGPLKSISRLDVPHNFDISTVIINDEREQLRRILLDDELPEVADRVRSPTEIAGRMRRYDRNRGGATTRLALEFVVPLVQRTVDLIAKQGLLPKDLTVDQILTEAVVAAPAAAAQRTDKVEKVVSWVQMMAGLFGPNVVALNAQVEKIIPGLARDMGIDETYIRRATDAENLKMLIDQAVQQALQQQKQAEQAQPELPPPADAATMGQAYVNGGLQ